MSTALSLKQKPRIFQFTMSSFVKKVILVISFLFLALSQIMLTKYNQQNTRNLSGSEVGDGPLKEEEGEPFTAVLFPWFANALGIVVFFLLTRYVHALPYTAVMFILGTAMGIGVERMHNTDQLSESIADWADIDSEVLLLSFLPGLLFRDAFQVNFHLFMVGFWQIMTLAFPAVLAGTTLTALVAKYIFPYDWSFNLSMAFGAILAATDPVAVASLLNEVGAPPRLKMHISGESMFNDGSAMVFYTIFKDLYLKEMGIEGYGKDIDFGEGVKIFCQMALGGAAIGLAFGFGLMFLLYMLKRRLEREENVIQVGATITIAYLSYYVSEAVSGCSGVIAVVICGITTRAFGGGMVNDPEMMESFWILVEHLLNTVLFTLGGVVWGTVIANGDQRSESAGEFTGTDWGYLFALYLLLVVIRYFLIFGCYPLISRIGLKSNWQEAFFMSYSGLRGAVGIALAISLDHEIWSATQGQPDKYEYREDAAKLFGMVGGIALLTLLINGTFAGPLLMKLGLVKCTATREKILTSIERKIFNHALDDLLHLLTDPRFMEVDFAVVSSHVPHFKHLTLKELKDGVERNKTKVAACDYSEPNLHNLLPYLIEQSAVKKSAMTGTRYSVEEYERDFEWTVNSVLILKDGTEHTGRTSRDTISSFSKSISSAFSDTDKMKLTSHSSSSDSANSPDLPAPAKDKHDLSPNEVAIRAIEIRHIFIESLQYAYNEQVNKGELDSREGVVLYLLLQSVEFAFDAARRGEPLNDWEASHLNEESNFHLNIGKFLDKLFYPEFIFGKREGDYRANTIDYMRLRKDVHLAMAFIEAHRHAQKRLQEDFISASSDVETTAAFNKVLKESEDEVKKAEKALASLSKKDLKVIVSHLLCTILLNKIARHIEHLSATGVLSSREASEYMEEIVASLNYLRRCSTHNHGEMSQKNKEKSMKHIQCSSRTLQASLESPMVCGNTNDISHMTGELSLDGTVKINEEKDDGDVSTNGKTSERTIENTTSTHVNFSESTVSFPPTKD